MTTRGVATTVLFILSCSGDKPAASEGPRAKQASTSPPGSTGSIAGTIRFEGEAPEMPELVRHTESGKPRDPACDSKAKAEHLVVKDGGVKDVVVRLAVGAAPKPATVPAPAIIDQKDCRYIPHVVGIVAGQKVAFRNSDATMHNVHTYKGDETVVNIAQPKGDADKVMDVPVAPGNEPYRATCDVHPWMLSYVLVTDHAHFAVTGEDGSFKLDNLPLGSYKLQAWHPHLGEKTIDVKVEPGKPVEVTFPAFTPGDYKAPG
jgi:plastocyanin